jgi:1-acyl-sn-glycerol-3-phosphate acyltransferase
MNQEPISAVAKVKSIVPALVVWGAVVAVTVWWCSLIVLASPMVCLLDKRRRFLHTLSVLWARSVVAVLPSLRYEIKGTENLMPVGQPAIYVANHQSQSDILALFMMGTQFRWLAKHSLFLVPIFGWALWVAGNVPVKRNDRRSRMQCMDEARKVLELGVPMVFFPEGTRSTDGVLKSFKLGAFSLARDAHVPLVPVTIVGADSFLPKGSFVPQGNSFEVIIHPRIEVGQKTALELSVEARNAIASALPTEKRGAVVMTANHA